MSLVTAIAKVQTLAGALSGIKQAPTNPPESSAMFPFSVAYAKSGIETANGAGFSTALHTLVCELHCQRSNLPLSVAQALPLYEAFAVKLLGDPTLGGTVSTINQIRYTFGQMEYASVQTIGYQVEIDVKINPTH